MYVGSINTHMCINSIIYICTCRQEDGAGEGRGRELVKRVLHRPVVTQYVRVYVYMYDC